MEGDVVVWVVEVTAGGEDPSHPANKARVPITAAPARRLFLNT